MRNPFTAKEEPDRGTIVVLNGVSGPGTYALAQMLTGGATGERAKDSERLLREINHCWDNKVEPSKELRGVEAIVDVTISPPDSGERQMSARNPGDELPAESQDGVVEPGHVAVENPQSQPGHDETTDEEIKRRVKDKFYDKRVVERWDYVPDDHAAKPTKPAPAWIRTFPVLD